MLYFHDKKFKLFVSRICSYGPDRAKQNLRNARAIVETQQQRAGCVPTSPLPRAEHLSFSPWRWWGWISRGWSHTSPQASQFVLSTHPVRGKTTPVASGLYQRQGSAVSASAARKPGFQSPPHARMCHHVQTRIRLPPSILGTRSFHTVLEATLTHTWFIKKKKIVWKFYLNS